jgi:hypothetical protein
LGREKRKNMNQHTTTSNKKIENRNDSLDFQLLQLKNWENMNQQTQTTKPFPHPKTMKITHNSWNTSSDPLNWENSELTLSFPFTILKKESHPNGKPSLYIYTIQHNQPTI